MENKLYNLTMRNTQAIGNKLFAEVPVELLYSDDRYQRGEMVSTRKVNKLIANWNPAKMDPLRVAPHDDEGRFSVINGEHRLKAAKALGYDFLVCEILRCDGIEEEAKLFATQNDEVDNLTPLQKHKANVLCGVPENVLIQSLCEKYDIKISAGKAGSRKTSYLSGFGRAVVQARSNPDVTKEVFRVIYEARWHLSSKGLCSEVLQAIYKLFLLHTDDRDKVADSLIHYMRHNDPKYVLACAMERYPKRTQTARNVLFIEDEIVTNYGVTRVYGFEDTVVAA